MIQLDSNQQRAKDLALAWFQNSSEPIFKIFGYAGTGKTTIVSQIVEEIEGHILYGAYTGKATEVMNQHGLNAATIHSLIYRPVPPNKHLRDEYRKRLKKITDKKVRAAMEALIAAAGKLRFVRNVESKLLNASLLVLDECSMIDEKMLDDLLDFGVPLLVLGDPGQLPPIKGTGALVHGKPDVMLTEIHRQAKGDPIINLAWRARIGHVIEQGSYGDSEVIPLKDMKARDVLGVNQVLTGKNDSRRRWNQTIRQMREFSGTMPQVGEKLICLRNHPELGLNNGTLCTVLEVLEESRIATRMKLRISSRHEIETLVHRAHFEEYERPGLVKSLEWWDLKQANEFDFGYVITVHKAQGSQWDKVMLYDDGFLHWDQVERRRWLYTGITRAAKSIVIVS